VILSEERQTHFAHILVDGIWNDDLVDYTDDDEAMRQAKRGIIKFVQAFTEVDENVRQTISNLKRNVPEGSPEWDIMYSKYFEEEMRRRAL
jgi:uncharacterized protein